MQSMTSWVTVFMPQRMLSCLHQMHNLKTECDSITSFSFFFFKMITYLIGGQCLKGVEYVPNDTMEELSSASSSLSDVYTFAEPSAYADTSTCFKGLGLSSEDFSLRLSQVGQQCMLELDASRNQITAIPTQLELFISLTRLVLSNNSISIIPSEIYQHLVQLQTLNLSENQIEILPEDMPSYLPRLVSLSLDGNLITSLPDTIGNWKHLREFRLGSFYGGNQIRELPDTISDMTSLVDLDVSFNQLETLLPDTFLHLPNINCINLSHNQLTVLPDTFLFGSCHKLTTIDLSDNLISTLPQMVATDILRLKKLELLNVSNNQLSILPTELLDQPHIQVIIKGNPITEFSSRQDEYHHTVQDMIQRASPTTDYPSTSQPVTSIEQDIANAPFLVHSLREITLRSVALLSSSEVMSRIPDHLSCDLNKTQTCPSCDQPYIREWISSAQLKSYRGHPSVVRKVRFCDTKCWQDYREILNQEAIRIRDLDPRQQQQNALEFINQHEHTMESGSIDWIMAAVSAASVQEEQVDILANVYF